MSTVMNAAAKNATRPDKTTIASRTLVGFFLIAAVAGAGATYAKTPKEKDLEGKNICWAGHGKAEFHRDHTYAFTPADGQQDSGRWAILEDGTLSLVLKSGENQYVKVDIKGSKLTMLDGEKWTGNVCR